jgi:ech hydrogenase subunit C
MKTTKNIMIFGGSGCGLCAAELRMCFTSVRDIGRYGFIETGNPKIADVFIISGSLNARSARAVRNLRAQMPAGSFVVSAGECAAEGFRMSGDDHVSSVGKITDVDLSVEGCPIRPQDVIEALAELFSRGKGEPDENQ